MRPQRVSKQGAALEGWGGKPWGGRLTYKRPEKNLTAMPSLEIKCSPPHSGGSKEGGVWGKEGEK